MENVNRTLYIPLYGKAYVSRKGILLRDKKAEEIWKKEGFPLKGRSRSKWLAYNMGMRAAVFDRWAIERMGENPGAVVLHLGCGLDSRAERMGNRDSRWFDVDFPEVIQERRGYYSETQFYRILETDIRSPGWIEDLPGEGTAIVIMEGVSMYLPLEELRAVLKRLKARFPKLYLLMDCYTEFGARASKYKNPINDVGVTLVHGIDAPGLLEEGTALTYIREHDLTPDRMIRQLSPGEQMVFRTLFAGRFAKKIYRLYEFQ